MAAIGDIARITAKSISGSKGPVKSSGISEAQQVKNGLKKQEMVGKRDARKQAGYERRKEQIRSNREARGPRNGPDNPSRFSKAFPKDAQRQSQKDFWENGLTTKDKLQLKRTEREVNKNQSSIGSSSNFKRYIQREKEVEKHVNLTTLSQSADGKFHPKTPYVANWKGSTPKVNSKGTQTRIPREETESSIAREDSPLRKQRREQVRTGRQRQDSINESALNTKHSSNMFGSAFGTLGTGARSAMSNLGEKGNLKKAGIGVLQSGVVSAGGHGGLAAIQGEDPWEAAKTGFIRGAGVGVGYQGLKAATHTNTGSLTGNLKAMGKTSKQLYQAHTTAGNAALKGMDRKDISPQLMRVLEQGKRSEKNHGIFGF